MTNSSELYNAFYRKIEKDYQFFSYYNLTDEEAVELAQSRAKGLLHDAVAEFKLNSLDIDIQLDEENEVITPDLTNVEIDILASIMFKIYLSRDVATLKSMINIMSSSDLKMLYAPANERKTFMDMYAKVQSDLEEKIQKYIARDRLTGKRKTLEYE